MTGQLTILDIPGGRVTSSRTGPIPIITGPSSNITSNIIQQIHPPTPRKGRRAIRPLRPRGDLRSADQRDGGGEPPLLPAAQGARQRVPWGAEGACKGETHQTGWNVGLESEDVMGSFWDETKTSKDFPATRWHV